MSNRTVLTPPYPDFKLSYVVRSSVGEYEIKAPPPFEGYYCVEHVWLNYTDAWSVVMLPSEVGGDHERVWIRTHDRDIIQRYINAMQLGLELGIAAGRDWERDEIINHIKNKGVVIFE